MYNIYIYYVRESSFYELVTRIFSSYPDLWCGFHQLETSHGKKKNRFSGSIMCHPIA